jgi:hypothetical protein
MYTNLHEFGKAYQGELQRVAGVGDELQVEGRRKGRPKGQGLLRRLLSSLSGRKREQKADSPVVLGEPHSSWIG